jgi:hypothetical protein
LNDPLPFLISNMKFLIMLFIDAEFLKGNYWVLTRAYFSTKSLLALRHYKVELKKQVFPKFLNPRYDR